MVALVGSAARARRSVCVQFRSCFSGRPVGHPAQAAEAQEVVAETQEGAPEAREPAVEEQEVGAEAQEAALETQEAPSRVGPGEREEQALHNRAAPTAQQAPAGAERQAGLKLSGVRLATPARGTHPYRPIRPSTRTRPP